MTRHGDERRRHPRHCGLKPIVRWRVPGDGASAEPHLGPRDNLMESPRYPGQPQLHVCCGRFLKQLPIDSELQDASPASCGERPAAGTVALRASPPASRGRRPSAPSAALCTAPFWMTQ